MGAQLAPAAITALGPAVTPWSLQGGGLPWHLSAPWRRGARGRPCTPRSARSAPRSPRMRTSISLIRLACACTSAMASARHCRTTSTKGAINRDRSWQGPSSEQAVALLDRQLNDRLVEFRLRPRAGARLHHRSSGEMPQVFTGQPRRPFERLKPVAFAAPEPASTATS